MSAHLTKPIEPDKMFSALLEWIPPGNREDSSPSRSAREPNENIIEMEKALPAQLPGIDTKAGLEIVGGNKKLYRKLLGKFRNNFFNFTKKMRAVLEDNNLKEAERLAHTLKGVSGNIGAGSLAALAGELEIAMVQGNHKQIELLMEPLSHELSRILPALEILQPLTSGIFEESAKTSNERVALETFLDTLQSLEPHLKSRKPKKCAPAMEEIIKLPWEDSLKSDVSELNQQIEKYKFKEAMLILKSLKSKLEESDFYNE